MVLTIRHKEVSSVAVPSQALQCVLSCPLSFWVRKLSSAHALLKTAHGKC